MLDKLIITKRLGVKFKWR